MRIKVLPILVALSFLAVQCGRNEGCRISGKFDDLRADTLLVEVNDSTYAKVEYVDTVLVKDGTFEFTVPGDIMRMLIIREKGPTPGSGGIFNMMSYPGEKVVLKGTFRNRTMEGTGFYADQAGYKALEAPVRASMDSIGAIIRSRSSAGEDYNTVRREYSDEYSRLMEKIDDIAMDFIKTHPESPYSGYLINTLRDAKRDEVRPFLSEKVVNGPAAPYVAMIDRRAEQRRIMAENAKKIVPGNPAPDFTLPDPDGNPLSLSDLRGQYVVLDFWGVWCYWCMKGVPDMKAYYKKYAGKFEILGIDSGDTEQKWKDCIKENGMDWKHVRNDEKDKVNVSTLYAVHGYPTKIIVDPEGKIEKVVVGESEEFYKYLDTLFKK